MAGGRARRGEGKSCLLLLRPRPLTWLPKSAHDGCAVACMSLLVSAVRAIQPTRPRRLSSPRTLLTSVSALQTTSPRRGRLLERSTSSHRSTKAPRPCEAAGASCYRSRTCLSRAAFRSKSLHVVAAAGKDAPGNRTIKLCVGLSRLLRLAPESTGGQQRVDEARNSGRGISPAPSPLTSAIGTLQSL